MSIGIKRLVLGALGGALGGVAMKAVVHVFDANSFGLSARTDANATHSMRQKLGLPPIPDSQAEFIGGFMHYGFAIGAGLLYAAGIERFPQIGTAKGTAFGALLWLFGDELAVTLSGLEDPRRTPMVSHASSLGAHLLYSSILTLLLGEFSSRRE